jgi:hypothetical protein
MNTLVEKAIDQLIETLPAPGEAKDYFGPSANATVAPENSFEPPEGEEETPDTDKHPSYTVFTDEEAAMVEEFIQWKLDEFWEGMHEQVADYILDQTSVMAADAARTLTKDVIKKFQEGSIESEGE